MGSWVDWGWALGGDCGSLSVRGWWCNLNAFSESAGWVWGMLWPPSLVWGAFFAWTLVDGSTGVRPGDHRGTGEREDQGLWFGHVNPVMRQTGAGGTRGQAGAGWAHSLNSFVAWLMAKPCFRSSYLPSFFVHPPYPLFLIVPGRRDLAFAYAQARMNAQGNLHILEFRRRRMYGGGQDYLISGILWKGLSFHF